jgi:hypothetical protein
MLSVIVDMTYRSDIFGIHSMTDMKLLTWLLTLGLDICYLVVGRFIGCALSHTKVQ